MSIFTHILDALDQYLPIQLKREICCGSRGRDSVSDLSAQQTLTLMELVTHHLDQTGTFIRILLMDFSSAFNTLQMHLLLSRLLDLDVSPSIVLWVRAFLRDRPQTVCVNSVKSNELILNTEAPQACVLSPILFSIYTNESMSNTITLTLIKFAEDMALVARLKDEKSLSSYFNFIGHLMV